MTLGATALAQQWVAQFDEEDRSVAQILVDSLRCISADAYIQELRASLQEIRDLFANPIAIYAAREINAGDSYFLNKRNRPNAIIPGGLVGSEGVAANLATIVTRESPNHFLNHPPIMTLRKKQCRNIVIIDDVVGSGRRVCQFLTAMLRDSSLKSWRSFGWISFHVVSYSASQIGEDNVRSKLCSGKDDIHFHHSYRLTEGAQQFTLQNLNAIKRVCVKYRERLNIPNRYTLGFGNALCTLVFAHGCPNNSPGILWHQAGGWLSLFPNRTIPADLLPCFLVNSPIQQQAKILDGLDATLVAKNRWFTKGSQGDRNALLVLVAIRRNARTVRDIVVQTDLPRSVVEKTVESCKLFGLISEDFKLTSSGRDGLRRAEAEIPPPSNSGEHEFYFPSALRGGQV